MNKTITCMKELQIHINRNDKTRFTNGRSIHVHHLPGINTLSAILIISEIGVDMKQFESDKKLAWWAGLAPANNESTNKKNSSYF